jgi:DNA-binding NarL/FixJ family response regulator
MGNAMYVLLADDQKSVRTALKLMLEQQDPVTRIEAAANAGDLLTKLGMDCPDLILLDWGLPGLAGDALVPTIKKLCPAVKVISLSGQSENNTAALAAGCCVFISKTDPPERLLGAIQSILENEERTHEHKI